MSIEPLAYSYLRFSTPEQAQGDSTRRQTTGAEAWCQKNGMRLDDRLSIRDLGVSAFRGKHRSDKAGLGAFLAAVKAGKVPKGSFLIVENLDRLSREEERTALRLWMDILDAGINIVQLTPETIFRHEKSDMVDIIRAIIELSRGHSESARKSERNGATWANKLACARAGQVQPPRRADGRVTRAITDNLPGWIEERCGQLVLIPQHTATLRRIYELALAGYGCAQIAGTLTREGVAPWGRGAWNKVHIHHLLTRRQPLGEYLPKDGRNHPRGAPIPGYYPAAITQELWLRVQAELKRRGASGRKDGRPAGCRQGEHVHLFTGLIREARSGDSYVFAGKLVTGQAILRTRASVDGRGPCHTFPSEVLERAILEHLREIRPEEILGEAPEDTTLAELRGREARLTARIAELEEALEEGDVKALARQLLTRETELAEVTRQIREAERQAATPLGEAWGQAHDLLAALDRARDPRDARLRLKALLRRVVEGITLLVVSRGTSTSPKHAAVEVRFAGGAVRTYLVAYWPAQNGRGRKRRDARDALVKLDRPIDLSTPAAAAEAESWLAGLDLENLSPP